MMVFTHLLTGALIGVGVSALYPGYVPVAVGAGLVGGGLPDLDMLFVHRRTLHFPVLSPVAATVAGGLLLFRPTTVTVGLFCLLLAVAVHSVTDTLGGGKEMRPWRETDDRAVYNHVTGAWIEPRRVFYDGSVADLALSTLVAAVLLVTVPASYDVVVGALLVGAALYTFLRRWITRRISEEHRTFSGYIQHKLAGVFEDR